MRLPFIILFWYTYTLTSKELSFGKLATWSEKEGRALTTRKHEYLTKAKSLTIFFSFYFLIKLRTKYEVHYLAYLNSWATTINNQHINYH